MLAKRIIPCLDVKAGRVVKGVKFVGLRDAGDPVEVARVYDRDGADELCFLDITASHENRGIILDVVARTAEQIFMPLTVGGGISTTEDIRNLLRAGADKVSINTAAVRQTGRRRLGSIYPWRQKSDRNRCLRMVQKNGKVRGGRNTPHEHGSRRHQSRL